MILLLSLLLLSVGSACASPSLSWTADIDRVRPVRGSVYRGETLDLSCSFVRAGVPVDLTGQTATLYWQTNGMGAAWWNVPATVQSNGVSASFVPSMQPNSPQVLFFIGSVDADLKKTYRATGIIRLLHAPGETPNNLPLPALNIDFASVVVTNAPWLTIETDPIFTAYAQHLNPWIEQVGQTLAGLSALPPADSILSSDNATPNRVSSDWMLLGGSSYYLPEFALSLSNLAFQVADRWEHGTRLDRDGLYLRRDRKQADLTAGGLYALEPGEGAATYGATSVLAQGPYPRLIETRISYPSTGKSDEVFALRSDVDKVARQASYYWDESAGVLWQIRIKNGYLETVAITNQPIR